jgi:uncharacterized protein YcfL
MAKLILLSILALLILVSCTSSIETTTIDSCEYIVAKQTSAYGGGVCIIHKANCGNHGSK